jgi:hypothetical protein
MDASGSAPSSLRWEPSPNVPVAGGRLHMTTESLLDQHMIRDMTGYERLLELLDIQAWICG